MIIHILCSDINGIAICYKLGPLAHRPPPQPPAGAAPLPPPVPSKRDSYNGLENSLHYLNITAKPPFPVIIKMNRFLILTFIKWMKNNIE